MRRSKPRSNARLRGRIPINGAPAPRFGAPPDGYTLLEPAFAHAVNPFLYEVNSWYGLIAPARTPTEIIQKLNTEVTRSLHEPDARQRLYAFGAEPMDNTPEEFDAYIRAEMPKWSKVVKTAGIRAD